MPAWILVKAVDGWNPDDPMVWMTGYPVEVRATDILGGKEVPPKFVRFIISDATPAEVQAYCDMWERVIDWEFVAHDYALDGHRLNVFVKPELVSASGLNVLTREMVENYLTRWRATVVSIAANSVVFDATIFNAVASEGFWNFDITGIGFTEISYNQSTGVHRIRATYSGVPVIVAMEDAAINLQIEERGGSIVQHVANSRVTFDINRSSVFDWFKVDVKQKVDGLFARRKWAFTEAAVQAALAAGGDLTATRQQALNYLHNRLLD